MDIIRIALGIFLCFKGIEFLQNTSLITTIIGTKLSSFGNFTIILLSHYIVFAHLVGGIMLILGVFTRFGCLIQIPILLGALFFVDYSGGMFKPFSEIFLTLLILLLLIYFLIAGNGPWAMKLADVERKKRTVE